MIWAVTGCLAFPAITALLTVPDLGAVYRATSPAAMTTTALFGLIWGISAILFGLGVNRLGLALGFGIIIGSSAALGALVPLVVQHPEQIATAKGITTLAGVLLIVLGVAGCSAAGRLREEASTMARRGSFRAGLVICLLSAMGAPAVNFGLAFGGEIVANAGRLGAIEGNAINAVWPVLFAGGLVANSAYCGWLISRRGTWRSFTSEVPAMNLPLAAAMGFLWFGSNLIYGYGSQALGDMGLVLGWPVFMGAVVLTANGWGIVSGEWRDAPAAAMRWVAAGVALLIAGVSVIGYASSLG